ncbi:transposase family protein [Streptomyces sp. NBC_01614]|uniref:transposase family protein n=1 Tax=Streptomyces sp. NBC_01614 TaxID=2975897 RepID=UPI003864D393
MFLQDLVRPRRRRCDRKHGGRRRVVIVRSRASAERAACPVCGTVSGRAHSRYADTAVGGRHVVIELQVRRFRCRDRTWRQATSVEQIDGLTFRHGRRGTGLQSAPEQVAVMLTVRAGARLADTLAVRASRSTLLRQTRRMPEPEGHTPRCGHPAPGPTVRAGENSPGPRRGVHGGPGD